MSSRVGMSCSMSHYEVLMGFRNKVLSYVDSIFKCYGNELLLRLEDYNLLENKNNCIESSTSTGFIMEEFLVSKLAIYTKTHRYEDGEYKIDRLSENMPTTQISYDCSSWINQNLFAMINVKANKSNSVKAQDSNNAVAAIRNLYSDFVEDRPSLPKCYMILKVFYRFGNSERDGERKIFVVKTEAFFIDEIDFSIEHKQDKRNWSEKFDPCSGRLQVSTSFREKYSFSPEEISYANTRRSLQCIIDRNANLVQKR